MGVPAGQIAIDGDTKIEMKNVGSSALRILSHRLGTGHLTPVTASASQLEEKEDPLPTCLVSPLPQTPKYPVQRQVPASHGGQWKMSSRGRPKPTGPASPALAAAEGGVGGEGGGSALWPPAGTPPGLLQKDRWTLDRA